MGEETFLFFPESKCFGERGQGHKEETQGVFQHNVSSVDGQGQNLGSIDDLFGHDVLSVKHIQNEARIEPLEIVS